MVTPRLGFKYASAYDTSFYWKEFPSRFYLIKIKSSFYKIFKWIHFFRLEIKAGADWFSRIIQKPDIVHLTAWCVAIGNLIKKWFNSSNQVTLEHVKHQKSL